MTTTQRARKPANKTLGEIFSAAFETRDPHLSYGAIADWASRLIGRRVTDNAVILYHRDRVESPDPLLVAAFALVYELELADLPERERVRCAQATEVFRELGTPPGTRTRNLQLVGVA